MIRSNHTPSLRRQKIRFRITRNRKRQPRSVFACLLFLVFAAASGAALQPKMAVDSPAAASTPKSNQRDHRKDAGKKKHPSDADEHSDTSEKNAYDYSLPGADGQDVPLANFKGKYILVVNLGRKSTYDDQLPALIKFNDDYKAKGFVVIGVPSDDFGNAEPGTNPEIQKAYADAKADFPIMSVSKLRGEEELPFYLYLTTGKSAPPGGPIHWNYTKFLIDKNGKVIARFAPDEAPESPAMLSTISQVLEGTYKPKYAGGEHKAAGNSTASDDDDDE